MISLCLTNLPTSRLKQAPGLSNPQTSLVQDVCATRLCFASLEQSHKHILNVLHQYPPVPQSHATSLIPASSISSSAWGLVVPRAFTRVPDRSHHHIFSEYLPGCHSQNPPRSFKVGSHSSKVSGIRITSSPAVFIRSSSSDCSRSTIRIICIGFRMFMYCDVVCISVFIQHFSPELPVHVLQIGSPSEQNNRCPPHVFTRFRLHL